MKRLVRLHNDTVAKRESEYSARLVEGPVSGDVELF